MSVISNIHTAQVYDAKKSKALTGQRLIKIVAKADKDGNYGPHLQQTLCMSVPVISMDSLVDFIESSRSLDAHILEMLENAQKGLITDKIKAGAGTSITSEELEISELVKYLDQSGDSDKWDTARIASWFEDNIAEALGLKLIEVGNDEESMGRKLLVAQKRFAESLASKSKIPSNVMIEVNKMLHFAGDKSDAIYKRFYARVNPEAKIVELEEALGF